MIKRNMLLVVTILGIFLFGCKSLKEGNDSFVKNQFKVIAIHNNLFLSSILLVCMDNNNEKYLLLTDSVCKHELQTNKYRININDTLNIVIYPRQKPPFKNFIFDSGFNTQQKSSLFVISNDSLTESIAIVSKDSIIANFYDSPDVCGVYLIYR